MEPRFELATSIGHYPHAFRLRGTDIKRTTAAHTWCEEQFGEPGYGRWGADRRYFYFHSKDDAFAFRLRWC